MKFIKLVVLAIGTLMAVAAWCALAVFLAFDGWWMKPAAAPGNHDAFFTEAKRIIDQSLAGNAALILIEDGEIIAEYFVKPERSVDAHTVFPTASFSKWITAMGVMALVEDGRIDLDEPVSSYLTRWRLPDSEYDEAGVTTRRLLSHMAGLTDGLGFGDYRADEELPTLEQTLSNPRASSGREAAIAIGAKPGEGFVYSGGGYLILQLLIEEASGESYQDFIRNRILTPLEMRDSSFAFIGDVDRATKSFSIGGEVTPQYKYASAAATGFSSSAADLSRLAKAVMTDNPALGLRAMTLERMRQPEAFVLGSAIWGLGTILYAPTPSGAYVYGHDGANEPAINASVRINPDTDDAFVMLVNGHPSLASDIGGEWVLWQTGKPDILSTETALKSALLPAAIGSGLILLLITFVAIRRNSSAKS